MAQKATRAGIVEKVRPLWAEFSDVFVVTHASSIAFFTFLSLAPMLAISISLLSVVGISEQDVLSFLQALIPEALSGTAQTLVEDAFKRSGLALSISTLVLLWSASKGAKAMIRGLNRAYGQKETRTIAEVSALSVAAGIILAVLFALLIYLVFSGVISSTLSAVVPGLNEQSASPHVLRSLLIMAAGTASLALFYKVLPAGKRRLVSQLPGAALATAACAILSLGFRIYVDHFANVTALYGSIAAVALLLLWLYLIAFIIVSGGFVNRALDESFPQGI